MHSTIKIIGHAAVYRADCDAVCTDQSVAGAQTIVELDGRSASVKREIRGKSR